MTGRHRLELRAGSGADARGLAELMQGGGLPVDATALAGRIEAVRAGQGAVLLALEWGPPSGVIVLNWGWTLQADARLAHISLLLVDPAARRRGIGRLLVKAAAQAARAAGCGELRITPPPDANELSAFCVAAGFVDQGGWLSRSLKKRGHGQGAG